MSRWIGLAAALLPAHARERYREQWLADLRDAPEVGVRASGIVVGALLFVATVNRTAPEISGMTISAFATRLARWGLAFIAAYVILAFSFFAQGGTLVPLGTPDGSTTAVLLTAASLALGFGYVVSLVIGLGLLVRALVYIPNTLARVSLGLLIAGTAAFTAGLLGNMDLLAVGIGVLLVIASGVVGLIVITSNPPSRSAAETASRARRLTVAALGSALLAAVVVTGTLDMLVLNPLAKVPGATLDEIYTGIGPGLGFNLALVVVWTVFWGVLALGLPLLGWLRGDQADRLLVPRHIAAIALGLIGAAVFFKFWAGFGMGMDLADTFATDGGDSSVASSVLALVGTAALVAAVFTSVAPRRVRPAPEPVGALA